MAPTECSDPYCARPVKARGMCSRHYKRFMRVTPKSSRPPVQLGAPPKEVDLARGHRTFDLAQPDMAYLFGFLQTDGTHSSLSRNRGRVSVELSRRDLSLLERFQRLVPYPSTITFRSRSTNFTAGRQHQTAVWCLFDLEARRALESLGLPPGKKSAIIEPPRRPFSEPDYVRALIDADGSVGYTGKGLPFVSFTTASPRLMAYVCDKVFEVTGVRRTVRPNKRDDIYNLLLTCDSAVKFARWIYYEGCLALERKYVKAVEVIAWARPPDMKRAAPRRSWTSREDEMVLAMSTAEAAEKLGRTEKSVNIRRYRLIQGITGVPRY
ncbi:LAGLIDADG family homing endonuclease [Spirillospora sp. NPDC052269]